MQNAEIYKDGLSWVKFNRQTINKFFRRYNILYYQTKYTTNWISVKLI